MIRRASCNPQRLSANVDEGSVVSPRGVWGMGRWKDHGDSGAAGATGSAGISSSKVFFVLVRQCHLPGPDQPRGENEIESPNIIGVAKLWLPIETQHP
jgi:hypothetical protein